MRYSTPQGEIIVCSTKSEMKDLVEQGQMVYLDREMFLIGGLPSPGDVNPTVYSVKTICPGSILLNIEDHNG